MDFADPRANARRRFDLRQFGVDEHAADDAGFTEPGHRPLEFGFLPDDVQATFRGDFVPPFRHQHGHFRPDPAGDVDHFVGGGHFEVELDLREQAQLFNVVILNVAAVFAQVHGDAVGTAQMRFDGAPDGIGFVGLPRLADRGNVVDIDAQFDHSCISLKILRDSNSLPPV